MFRAIFELVLTAIVIFFVRAVIGIIVKGFGQSMHQPMRQQEAPRSSNSAPRTAELKKDPVCGTYIATDTSIKGTVGGQTYHFCSRECRDKYVASMAR